MFLLYNNVVITTKFFRFDYKWRVNILRLDKIDAYSRITLGSIFVTMTLFMLFSAEGDASISKLAAFSLLLIFFLMVILGKYGELNKTVITPIVIAVLAYIAIYTISLFYATTGRFALLVYSYYLAGFATFLLTILLINRNSLNARLLLYAVSLSVGISGILSIDAASSRIITPLLESVHTSVLGHASLVLGTYEVGSRMSSILGNPNVFGGLASLGVLAAAFLFLSSNSKKDEGISAGLLIVNAVALLYCFSLGSLISLFFTTICFIVFVGRELRSKAVYVVLSTIIFAFLSVFIGLLGMSKTGIVAMLPLASLIVIGGCLAFVLNFTEKFSVKVSKLNSKNILILVVAFVVIASAFIVAALSMAKPYSYDASNPVLNRSVALETGDYKLEIYTEDIALIPNVAIYSQSYYQAATTNRTYLFNGAIEDDTVNFTVPDDSDICFINIPATQGAIITKLDILDVNDHVVKEVMPDYLLVPAIMANRLQGVLVSQNAALRIIHFQDGLKIAKMSPLIGHGPGAFESKLLTVQDFKYETKSAHNHYIQTLDEVGIIGLLAFLSIFLFSFIIMIRRFRSAENRLLYGTLFSMLIMITIHNAVEVNFIYGVYNIIAFMIFAMISAEYGQKKLTNKELKLYIPIPRAAKYFTLTICIIALLINIGQFASVHNVKKVSAAGDTIKFLDALSLGTMLDFTNDVSYKTSFLNAFSMGLPDRYQERANVYASDIEKHNSFGSLSDLVNYYIKIGDNENAYQTLNNRQKLLRYDTDAWNATFDFYRSKVEKVNLLEDNESEVLLVKKYALAASQQLKGYLETSPKDITLSKENEVFRNSLLAN